MLFYIISFILAGLFILPELAEWYDFSLGGFSSILHVPYIGLTYMAVFFHELGHTVTSFLFGYIALPSFDFEYGGGMTYAITGQMWALQGGMFILALAGLWQLFRAELYLLLATAVLLFAGYVALAFSEWHQVAISFMGYGSEIILALFCMIRAILKLTEYGAIERYLNMIFGLFAVGRNLILLGGLMHSDIAREVYSQQKGQHLMGDFDKIADILNKKVEFVAGISLVYMALMLLSGAAFVWWARAEETG